MAKGVVESIVVAVEEIEVFLVVSGGGLIKEGKDFLEEGGGFDGEDGGQTVIIKSFLDLEEELFFGFSHCNNKNLNINLFMNKIIS